MSAFPIALVKHLAIMDLVKLTRVCLTTAIKKNCLEHVLADLVEELDEEDLPRIKTQLDRVDGIVRSIIDKRIKWETWPTGPVVELRKVYQRWQHEEIEAVELIEAVDKFLQKEANNG